MMFSENILFSVLKNKKQKTIFCLSNVFVCFFILENRKLLLRIVIKQTLSFPIFSQ